MAALHVEMCNNASRNTTDVPSNNEYGLNLCGCGNLISQFQSNDKNNFFPEHELASLSSHNLQFIPWRLISITGTENSSEGRHKHVV